MDNEYRTTKISINPEANCRYGKWQAAIHIDWLGKHSYEETDYVFDSYEKAFYYARKFSELRMRQVKDTLEKMKETLNANRTT